MTYIVRRGSGEDGIETDDPLGVLLELVGPGMSQSMRMRIMLKSSSPARWVVQDCGHEIASIELVNE
jgi:hypothetical protein